MTYEEPNRPAIQEVENWGARSHRELYESVHINNDPGQAATLASEWATMGSRIGDASQEIARGLQASESGWQGAAATKARGAMMQLSSWSESAAQAAAGIGARVDDQARIAQKARDTMPEPIEFDMRAMLLRGFATGGLIGLAFAAADVKVASDRANAAHQQAVQVMATMENESRAVDSDVPVFAMPPNPVHGEQTGQAMMLRGTMAPDGGIEAAQMLQPALTEPAIPESAIRSGEGGGPGGSSAIDPRFSGSGSDPATTDPRSGGGAPAFTSGGGPAGASAFPGGGGPADAPAFPGGGGPSGAPAFPGGGGPAGASAFPGGGPGVPPGIPGVDGPGSGFASPADQFLASTAGGGPGGSSGGGAFGGPNGVTTGQNAMPQLPGNFGPSGGAPDFTTQRPAGTSPQGTQGPPPQFTMPGGMPGTNVGGNQDTTRRQQPPQVPPIPSGGGGPFGTPGGGNFPGGNNFPGNNFPGTPGGGNGPGGAPRPPGSVPPPPFQPPPSSVRGVPSGFGGGVGGNSFSGGGGGGGAGGGAPSFTGGGGGPGGVPPRMGGEFAGRGTPGSLAGVGPVGGPVPPEERGLGPRGGGQPGQPGAPGSGAMGGMGGGGGRKEDDAERRTKYVQGDQIVEAPGADLPPSVIGGSKPKKKQQD